MHLNPLLFMFIFSFMSTVALEGSGVFFKSLFRLQKIAENLFDLDLVKTEQHFMDFFIMSLWEKHIEWSIYSWPFVLSTPLRIYN